MYHSSDKKPSVFVPLLKARFLSVLLIVFSGQLALHAQNPAYFQVTTEDGLPSNEVYSMLVDQRGFLWIGSDAGISKYNGVNFVSYSNPDQNTRSLAGLCESSSGRIYAHSFSGQIFYIENDSLFELKSWKDPLSNLSCDKAGNVWASSKQGLCRFSEKDNRWYGPFYPDSLSSSWAHGLTHADNGSYAIFNSGVGFYGRNDWTVYPFENGLKDPMGYYILSESETVPVVCSITGGRLYALQDSVYKLVHSEKLDSALFGKKLTNVKLFGDGKIWICTYDGAVIYDPLKDNVQFLLQGTIISDVIFDQEGNCWLSSLQDGIFRIPDLETPVWNYSTQWNNTISLLKLERNGQQFFFSTAGGEVGMMDAETNQFEFYTIPSRADIQSLNFETRYNTLYFFTNNLLYGVKDKKVTAISGFLPPVKDFCALESGYVAATSQGTFFYPELTDKNSGKQLCSEWSRKLVFSEKRELLFVATNSGLQVFKFEADDWKKKAHILDPHQVISLAEDTVRDVLYVLCFDGKIYSVNTAFQYKLLTVVDKGSIASDLLYTEEKLFIATNSGLFSFDLKSQVWERRTQDEGLASNDIRSMLLYENRLWLATSKGLQAISKSVSEKRKNGKIYLKSLFKEDEPIDTNFQVELNYDQSLSFMLEAAHYSSNEKFRYAYRLPLTDSAWNFVPANSKKVTIPAVPPGDFILEIKFVDYAGNDSANTIVIQGRVIPPFWQRWWFYVSVVIAGILVTFLLFRYRILLLKRKQASELQKMRLENELILSQQTALKAQMNPHFIFNVLNSIKGYIYENDKKKAAAYLGDFSDLVRRILTMSSRSHIKLSEELEALEAYIRLEEMLLDGNFTYELQLSDKLDTDDIRIPVLLIQPFIENAFQHGLRPKKGPKKLHLKFYTEQDDQILFVEISDNGIGRRASEMLKAGSETKHQPFALESSARRISLVNKDKSNQVGVVIQDILDKNNQVCGTQVILKIWMND